MSDPCSASISRIVVPLVCAAALLSVSGPAEAGWREQEVAASHSCANMWHPSHAVGIARDVDVIAYGQTHLYVATRARGKSSWVVETVDSRAGTGVGASVAIGPDGVIYVAYLLVNAGMAPEGLFVASNSGGKWTIDEVATGAGAAYHPSIAVSAAGKLMVAYDAEVSKDPSGEGEYKPVLKFATRSGSGWQTETLPQGVTALYSPDATSLAVLPDGSPVVLSAGERGSELVYRDAGGAWTARDLGVAPSVGWNADGGIAASGTARVCVAIKNNSVQAGCGAPADLALTTVPDSDDPDGVDVAALPDGTPLVVWVAMDKSLRVSSRQGSGDAWTTRKLAGGSAEGDDPVASFATIAARPAWVTTGPAVLLGYTSSDSVRVEEGTYSWPNVTWSGSVADANAAGLNAVGLFAGADGKPVVLALAGSSFVEYRDVTGSAPPVATGVSWWGLGGNTFAPLLACGSGGACALGWTTYGMWPGGVYLVTRDSSGTWSTMLETVATTPGDGISTQGPQLLGLAQGGGDPVALITGSSVGSSVSGLSLATRSTGWQRRAIAGTGAKVSEAAIADGPVVAWSDENGVWVEQDGSSATKVSDVGGEGTIQVVRLAAAGGEAARIAVVWQPDYEPAEAWVQDGEGGWSHSEIGKSFLPFVAAAGPDGRLEVAGDAGGGLRVGVLADSGWDFENTCATDQLLSFMVDAAGHRQLAVAFLGGVSYLSDAPDAPGTAPVCPRSPQSKSNPPHSKDIFGCSAGGTGAAYPAALLLLLPLGLLLAWRRRGRQHPDPR